MCHHRQGGAAGVAMGAMAGAARVEDIPREVPYPWDALARVSRTWLKQGDRDELVERRRWIPILSH
jgi:hypothetical protein